MVDFETIVPPVVVRRREPPPPRGPSVLRMFLRGDAYINPIHYLRQHNPSPQPPPRRPRRDAVRVCTLTPNGVRLALYNGAVRTVSLSQVDRLRLTVYKVHRERPYTGHRPYAYTCTEWYIKQGAEKHEFYLRSDDQFRTASLWEARRIWVDYTLTSDGPSIIPPPTYSGDEYQIVNQRTYTLVPQTDKVDDGTEVGAPAGREHTAAPQKSGSGQVQQKVKQMTPWIDSVAVSNRRYREEVLVCPIVDPLAILRRKRFDVTNQETITGRLVPPPADLKIDGRGFTLSSATGPEQQYSYRQMSRLYVAQIRIFQTSEDPAFDYERYQYVEVLFQVENRWLRYYMHNTFYLLSLLSLVIHQLSGLKECKRPDLTIRGDHFTGDHYVNWERKVTELLIRR